MRRLIAAVLAVALVGLALPAAANGTGEIVRSGANDTPVLIRDTQVREQAPGGVSYGILGTFLVTRTADGTEASVEVPADAVRYQVHEDGSVSFEAGDPQPDERKPVADVSAEEWEQFKDEGGDTTQYRSFDTTSAGVRPF